jgi:hypothetical protein
MGDVGRSIDAELRELQQRRRALHRWLRMTAIGPSLPKTMSAACPQLAKAKVLAASPAP